jgi:hypothetical protein
MSDSDVPRPGTVDPSPKDCIENAVVHLQRAILNWDSEKKMRRQLRSAALWLETAILRMRAEGAKPAPAKPALSPIIVEMPASQKKARDRGQGSPIDKSKN